MASSTDTHRVLNRFILTIIFLSGVSALIYQILWSRMLMLVFGTSVPAVSTVLSAYMAGLALGSLIFGRLADRGFSTLRLYAGIEIGIAVAALLVPLFIRFATGVYVHIGSELESHPVMLAILRFSIAFLILLPATTLIGGVLPVASKTVIRHVQFAGNRTGRLYSVNTIGSVLGAFACGFYLIKMYGVSQVNVSASLINFGIGIALVFLSRSASAATVPAPQPAPQSPHAQSHGLLLFIYGLAGFTALGYEVVWTRVLAFLLGNRVYAFTTIVTVFLAGLALGSFVFAKFVDRIKRPYLFFGLNEILIGLFGLCTIPIFNNLQAFQNYLYSVFQPNWLNYFIIKLAITFAPLLLPTFLMGAAFPIIVKICVSSIEDIGSQIGRINAANTAGAILGASLTGFILIPVFKISGTITLLASLYLVIGMCALSLDKEPKSRQVLFYMATSVAVLTFVLILAMPKGIGLGKTHKNGNLIYYNEGATATVAVFENLQKGFKFLEINGIGEVPTDPLSMQTFKALGHLPLMIHEDPKSVLMVTFGGGIAAGSAMLHPIEEFNCVEICEGVVGAARTSLSEENNRVLESPILNLHINDGRNYLLTTRNRFDVIISDATHPTGVDSWVLYTREFYSLCREKLNENGLFAQWVPLHDMTDFEYRSVIRTCASVFPESSLWVIGSRFENGHTLMVAAKNSLKINSNLFAQRMRIPAVQADLARFGFYQPDDLLAYLKLTPETIPAYTAGTIINTDDHSILAFPMSPFSREPLAVKLENINRHVVAPDKYLE